MISKSCIFTQLLVRSGWACAYPVPGFLHLWLLPSCEISSRSPWFAKRVVTNLSDVFRRNLFLHSQRPHAFFLTVASQCFQLTRVANYPTSLSLYSCVTVGRKPRVRSACCTLLRVLSRLAFLRPNSRNLAFFIVVWHVRHSLAFFGLFYGVGTKTHCLHFLKPLTQLLLSAWNYRTFSQDKGPLFSARSHSRRYKRLSRLGDVTGQKTILCGQDFENCGRFNIVQCLKRCRLRCFR